MAETLHDFTNFNRRWTKGRTLRIKLTVTKTELDVETNEPVTSAQDLTGGTIWVVGKKSWSDPDSAAVFRLNSADPGGVEFISAADGTARAIVAASKTAGLPDYPTVVYVECVWVGSDGEPFPFQKGTYTFHQNTAKAVS